MNAADWAAVATDCRNKADAARLLASIVKVPADAPRWWAHFADDRIHEACRDLAMVFTDLAGEATECALDAAEHEAVT